MRRVLILVCSFLSCVCFGRERPPKIGESKTLKPLLEEVLDAIEHSSPDFSFFQYSEDFQFFVTEKKTKPTLVDSDVIIRHIESLVDLALEFGDEDVRDSILRKLPAAKEELINILDGKIYKQYFREESHNYTTRYETCYVGEEFKLLLVESHAF